MSATMGFVDPFRAVNYLEGVSLFSWEFVSQNGGPCVASNLATIDTDPVTEDKNAKDTNLLVISSSWNPISHGSPKVLSMIRHAARRGATIVGIDTGAFLVAHAGLLRDRTATVHYEHIDAFQELFPDTETSENLYVFDENIASCCGGTASTDLALMILLGLHGTTLANAAARYIFHPGIRKSGSPQNPQDLEPLGATVPDMIRRGIKIMETNLEEPVSIADICNRLNVSQRQFNRLFAQYIRKRPGLYYRDIRLDRARSLVTQTDMPMSEIAFASGFSSHVYFSRAYKSRFGLPPNKDRIEGRIPFEFRAWPMHRKSPAQSK